MLKKQRTLLRFALSSGAVGNNQIAMLPYQITRTLFFARTSDALWQEARISKNMAMQIDGFPGSSNSFLTRTFRASLRPGTLIGNHYHSPIEFLAGVDIGLPSILVIRDPREAVNSWTRRWKGVPLLDGFAHYIRFHKALLDLDESVTVCDFNYVTKNGKLLVKDFSEKYNLPLNEDLPEDLSVFEPRNQVRKKGEDPETLKIADLINQHRNDSRVKEAAELYQQFYTRENTLK